MARAVDSINRLSSNTGKSSIGLQVGLGTNKVIIPEFPSLPDRLNKITKREYEEKVAEWRRQVQAQFPIQPDQPQSSTSQQLDPNSGVGDRGLVGPVGRVGPDGHPGIYLLVMAETIGYVTYIGTAAPGSSTTKPVWTIWKEVLDSAGNISSNTSASGVKWIDRLTASYS